MRTASYVLAALSLREPERDQVFVVLGFIAGLVWLVATTLGNAPVDASVGFAPFLVSLLLAICAIDARYGIIPDAMVLQLAALGVASLFATQPRGEWFGHVLAAGSALALGHIGHAAYRWLRGHDGFGLGDVKFVAAAALWIRWDALPIMILGAVLSALLSVAIVRCRGPLKAGDGIPFGPHLALALWIVYLTDPVARLSALA